MSDKCYICHETEGILLKTCNNKKCTAKTHSYCLQKQYVTLKECGFCKSGIIINKKFNYGKLIHFIVIILNIILHSYLTFIIIMGLNPLDPIDINFNDITVITNKDIYSINYILLGIIYGFNFIMYINIDKIKQIEEYTNKYGSLCTILLLHILELTLFFICHVIGYNSCVIFSKENCIFYTYKTFLDGLNMKILIESILIISFLTYKYFLPLLSLLLEPFYDEQFGQ